MNNLIQSAKTLEKLAKMREQTKRADEGFMRKALSLAKKAGASGEVPVGAIIVKDGAIVSRAYNEKEKKQCAIYHAEIIAIIKASKKLGWRLDGCAMYVTVEPCAMCAGAIASSRISRLVFGANEPKSGYCVSNGVLSTGETSQILSGANNKKVECEGGVLSEECTMLMQEFFRNGRNLKVPYNNDDK